MYADIHQIPFIALVCDRHSEPEESMARYAGGAGDLFRGQKPLIVQIGSIALSE
jgi:hypothetical protein